jgi:succinate dehydrogenase flavin-adding protein (antitoxin of CptAB toxin-antitoxin module)
MPDSFRGLKNNNSSKPKELENYKKQIMHKSKYIGITELEILLTDFLKQNMSAMTYSEVEEFDKVVLNIEGPLLKRYLVYSDSLDVEHDKPIMRILQEYVLARSLDLPKHPGHSTI